MKRLKHVREHLRNIFFICSSNYLSSTVCYIIYVISLFTLRYVNIIKQLIRYILLSIYICITICITIIRIHKLWLFYLIVH